VRRPNIVPVTGSVLDKTSAGVRRDSQDVIVLKVKKKTMFVSHDIQTQRPTANTSTDRLSEAAGSY
jgi:hypothetical protein